MYSDISSQSKMRFLFNLELYLESESACIVIKYNIYIKCNKAIFFKWLESAVAYIYMYVN